MSDEVLQADVRAAITRSDEMSRRAHGVADERLAQKLGALRTILLRIDQGIGATSSSPTPELIAEARRLYDDISAHRPALAGDLQLGVDELLEGMAGLPDAIARAAWSLGSHGVPSRPLFGALPLARVISQDVHSVTDYVHAAGCLGTALFADSLEARLAGVALGASIGGVSLVTDYRLSAAKVLPIEAHEAADYGWGLAAIAAPFVLGYARKSPIVAAAHVLFGVGTIVTSLLTDYRGYRGVGR
ncbi:MAG: hypothetical protein NVS3B10_07040 [Polyangiales bacterium]